MYKADFKWPDGAYIAVVLNMSWESWPDTLATAETSESTGERVPPPTAPYTRAMRPIYEHAYAETGGMQRMIDLWERHGIRSSCYADGLTVTLFPGLARTLVQSGHELLVQGWDHTPLTRQTVAEQAESIDRTIEAFDKVLDYRATGFSSSGGNITAETFGLLVDRGFKYACGLRNADVPYIMHVKGKKLVGMTSYAISEFNTHHGAMTMTEVMSRLKYAFDAMYDEGKRGWPKLLPYGTHPFVSAAFRTKPLEEMIEYMKKQPKVWFTTRGEIADYMLETYPDYDLAAFYPEAVNSDRQYGLGIGLGGAEAEEKMARYRRA